MEPVLGVFAPDEKFRSKDEVLWDGSVKANVGHGERFSRVANLVEVLLLTEHNTILSHCGMKPSSKINHNYHDLGARTVQIGFKPTPWGRKGRPRRVLINNFNAASGSTTLLLENVPLAAPLAGKDTRTHHVLPSSSHSAPSLKRTCS
ncbi:hypothetical protein LTR70_009574 [Exophiala xenobiotica]|uniref:Uncharacterized protein n=1 Tax=Lithohypha guttulata TaxID=1690604 RepID=A0ABR0JY89_9EURO|nr:hypothetical protein LTR24_009134 [Lithohypha guttulata]KAK5310308.1 hypothetical protein LTR70_009574 [Exophiala xenobiotica]